jgi:hypothetical protein
LRFNFNFKCNFNDDGRRDDGRRDDGQPMSFSPGRV